MSRIGKLPVVIPDGVQIDLQDGNFLVVKGPKGELSKALHPEMIINNEDGNLVITPPREGKEFAAMWGLTRTLINNMVEGVTNGFEKRLDLVGVGYRAALEGKKLVLQLGYSHPIEIEPGENMEIEVPANNKIIVRGIDKEKVGSLAANIRALREPEPYKGKGVRYEGEYVKIKAGKTGVK